jgi:hypothetical protein
LPDREKEQPKNRIFREKTGEKQRERDEISERLWPLVLRLIRRKKKLCLGCSIFFLKASLLNSFFDEKHKKTSREKTPQYKK